jgi:hypothetical protein
MMINRLARAIHSLDELNLQLMMSEDFFAGFIVLTVGTLALCCFALTGRQETIIEIVRTNGFRGKRIIRAGHSKF